MIGKHRLDCALATYKKAHPDALPQIRWRVFQLNPTMPPDGMDRAAYLTTKFGGPQRAREVYRVILREGLAEGIAFSFDRIRRTPNTLAAHGLIRLAQEQGDASFLVDRLFQAYFTEGKNIGDTEVLLEIADLCGLDKETTQSYLSTRQGDESLCAEDSLARASGITGVPHFIFNEKYSLSGAVSPEVLLRALELAEGS
jgi:predicted DsbA family dithiol-disulfide isomerase